MVGDDPASHVYVRNKIKSCERLGIKSTHLELSKETSQEELVDAIISMNNDDGINGILIQSPLPSHLDEESLTDLIDPEKDEMVHPVNLGQIVQGRLDGMIPCTPAGVMEMLRWGKVEISGKKAVVIGRSFNVGMPQALLLPPKVRCNSDYCSF